MQDFHRFFLARNQLQFHQVVPYDPARQTLVSLDLTAANPVITDALINNLPAFTAYINSQILYTNARYLIGGYDELRAVYGRSSLFNGSAGNSPGIETAEPRRLHLGTDIWGTAGTPVYAPLKGMVHSFAFNDLYGDYGATIILLHQLESVSFYTLYGHLSLADLQKLAEGQYITPGATIGHFGEPAENGHWPPHLHFQIILDMELYTGDYPGVCRYSERLKFLANCPDPDLIIQFNRYIKKGKK